MNGVWETVLVFIFGAGGLALINVIQERWKIRYQRRANKEDSMDDCKATLVKIKEQLDEFILKQNEFNAKSTKKFEDMEKSDAAQVEALKYVLLDRILYIGQSYIKHGEVTYDDRKRLRDMHDVYHNKLGGNGDAKMIMDAVDELPLKNT